MKTRKINKTIYFLAILGIGLLAIVCSFFINKKHVPKSITVVQGIWPYVDLHSATEDAETIVYGKVLEIGDTLIHETIDSNGKPRQELYKEIKLEIIEQIKGITEEEFIVFKEMGGETDQLIHQYEGYQPLGLSEEVILFLNQNAVSLAPDTMLRITDDSVSPATTMLPDHMKEMRTNSISVTDYLNAIADQFK